LVLVNKKVPVAPRQIFSKTLEIGRVKRVDKAFLRA
jgi:hypothetical protein